MVIVMILNVIKKEIIRIINRHHVVMNDRIIGIIKIFLIDGHIKMIIDLNIHNRNRKITRVFSTPPPSLLSLTIAPPPLPPLPPPPPPPPVTVVPHERESWIRSVKKTKTNESTEQKTQYLETMLRMPQQQKSMLNPSKFDRMRFADNRSLSTNNPTVPMNTDDLTDGSFHLVDDVHDHDDICTLEKILFNNDLNTSSKTSVSNDKSLFQFEDFISLQYADRSMSNSNNFICTMFRFSYR